jgi:hypothetical protein
VYQVLSGFQDDMMQTVNLFWGDCTVWKWTVGVSDILASSMFTVKNYGSNFALKMETARITETSILYPQSKT